jgi:hypothetical protein
MHRAQKQQQRDQLKGYWSKWEMTGVRVIVSCCWI